VEQRNRTRGTINNHKDVTGAVETRILITNIVPV